MVINTKEVDPLQLPSVPLSKESIKLLPSFAGIYFVISAKNRILYIGKSVRISNRWQGHSQRCLMNKFLDLRLAWFQVDQVELLTALENEFIQRFDPPFNGQERRKPLGDPVTFTFTLKLPLQDAVVLDELPVNALEALMTQCITSAASKIIIEKNVVYILPLDNMTVYRHNDN